MITPYYEKNGITIYCGDCLEVMPQLDIAFDCVIADPPYFKIVKDDWDRHWDSLDDYISWLEKVIIQIKKVLISKGAFYIFGDDKIIAYVQVMIDKYLTLLNSLVWYKYNSQPQKNTFKLRSYAPMTERILFYTPQLCPTGLETVKLDLNNFRPLREYFRRYQEAIGRNKKEIIQMIGQRGDHCFRWNSTQWDLPTKETYQELGEKFCTNGFERREYEDLRREYEDLRRTFNATNDTFDVITGPIVSQSEASETKNHATTKPLWLLSKLIQVSTNQCDVILDPFLGGGTTLVSAQQLGRQAIGIDISEDYCKIAVERLKQPSFFSIPDKPKSQQAKQLALVEDV